MTPPLAVMAATFSAPPSAASHRYVLDHALRQMGAWRAQGLDIGVAVNLSARTLIERELPDHIEAMCHRWAVPTNRLVLEITESMVVADPARALPILARLH